jgi:hypothetical protein
MNSKPRAVLYRRATNRGDQELISIFHYPHSRSGTFVKLFLQDVEVKCFQLRQNDGE